MPAYDLLPYEEIQQGECSLETLSVAEFCIQRVHLNWCMFLMNELMAACTDAHATRAAFIYGYLFLTFAMFRWQPPQGRQLQPARGHTIVVVQYEPCRVRKDTKNVTLNDKAFARWYDMMIIATNDAIRVPKYLIDVHGGKNWFDIDRENTYVQPRATDQNKLKGSPLPFYMTEHALNK